MIVSKIIHFILIVFPCCLFSILDLDELAQDFLLEVKKIDLPNYRDAFNPALIKWNDSFLLCFRIRDPLTKATNQMGLTWLDQQLNPVGQCSILENVSRDPLLPSLSQDPRLIKVGQEVYLVYNNLVKVLHREFRRMFIARLFFENDRFFLGPAHCLLDFESTQPLRHEKNWVPFDYEGQLLLAYSLNPHRILRLLPDESCETFAASQGLIDWPWGELRGGTPAILNGDHYLAFFHSCLDIATKQSQGKKMSHYFMGAYTFSSEPPFALTAISPEPLVHKKFYNGPAYQTWKPLRVVFPCGLVCDKNDICWVAYGRQDHEIWIVKIDKKRLLHSLVSISSIY